MFGAVIEQAAVLAVNPVPWARAQMAFTLACHIILVPLGVSWGFMALVANYRGVKNDTDAATAKRRVRESEAMVKALFDAGVPIVAGTDGALPGYSLLRSIEMYVEAGMTPMQAIESATRVPAASMGLSKDTGTIEAGKRADMIVLNADPLANISNIRKPRWVIAQGRVMDPAKLWAAAGFK